MNAAICSRVTRSAGAYVEFEVPVVTSSSKMQPMSSVAKELPTSVKLWATVPEQSNSTAANTTLPDGAEEGPVPVPFVAATVNEYSCPLVRPESSQVLAVVVQVPFGAPVTV